jgi:hypothetical protein
MKENNVLITFRSAFSFHCYQDSNVIDGLQAKDSGTGS